MNEELFDTVCSGFTSFIKGKVYPLYYNDNLDGYVVHFATLTPNNAVDDTFMANLNKIKKFFADSIQASGLAGFTFNVPEIITSNIPDTYNAQTFLCSAVSKEYLNNNNMYSVGLGINTPFGTTLRCAVINDIITAEEGTYFIDGMPDEIKNGISFFTFISG